MPWSRGAIADLDEAGGKIVRLAFIRQATSREVGLRIPARSGGPPEASRPGRRLLSVRGGRRLAVTGRVPAHPSPGAANRPPGGGSRNSAIGPGLPPGANRPPQLSPMTTAGAMGLADQVGPGRVRIETYRRSDARRLVHRELRGQVRRLRHLSERCTGGGAEGLIHAHHLKPISEVGEGYVVDPVKFQRPVRPDCRASIHHLSDPPYCIEDVRGFRRSH